LIRTVLSQHTADANSSRAFAALRRRFPRWSDVERAPAAAVVEAIRSAGLANVKAARLHEILLAVRARYGRLTLAPLQRLDDEVAMAALRTLPGVGPKTAACVLLFGLGRDVFPVDTHVHRLCRRLGFVPPGASAGRAQEIMASLVPRGRALEMHVNLIRHGRRICHARQPRCRECALAKGCPFHVRSGAGAMGGGGA
jgi:endonuclease-3